MGHTPAPLRAADVVGMLDGPAGIYLHVPFCERICPFCPYNKVLPRGDLPERYFTALAREVEAYLAAGAGGPTGFTSLYVGGGTPTLYPDLLAAVIARLPVVAERAIEVLPTHGTPDRLEHLREVGFTAVSIGAQSFHDDVLRVLHRPHDAQAARSAVRAAVGRVPLVDVDLIVDVELDDRLSGAFLRDLEECLALGVDQVSTYPLMRFGYTPFGTAHHDRRREHEILGRATRIAHAHGYERRSVWTFNRRGSPTYTSITRRRFLGLGAGASSFLGRDFLVDHFGVATYIAALDAGRLPIARWLHLGPVGGAAYDAFWQAYAGGISPTLLAGTYGPWAGWASAALRPLVAAGLVRRSPPSIGRPGTTTGGPLDPGAGYALTDRGFDVYHDLERWVTYQMIEPLWGQMLAEHEREGSPVHWVAPSRRRASRVWGAASRLLERPLPRS